MLLYKQIKKLTESGRIKLSILAAFILGILQPSMDSILCIQSIYLTLLGSLLLSLLFLDRILEPIIKLKNPEIHLRTLRSYYLSTLAANIYLIAFFFISYLTYSSTSSIATDVALSIDKYEFIKSLLTIAWYVVFGGISGFLFVNYAELVKTIIYLRFRVEYDDYCQNKSNKEDSK